MKKALSFALILAVLVCLAACGANSTPQESSTVDTPTQTPQAVSTEQASQTEEATPIENDGLVPSKPQAHDEFVKSYSIFAEKGAIVTWSDSSTGDFKYQCKCEACGETSGGTRSQRLVSDNASFNTGFTCSNSKCSKWGKPQRAVIRCKVTGEWVTVYD